MNFGTRENGDDEGAACWEQDYSRRGLLWGGAVHHNLPTGPGSRVLELGCGNGKTFRSLIGKGCDVVGIDFSISALSLCRSREPGGQCVCADAIKLPFRDASFDTVIAIHLFGHIDAVDRIRCTAEAARILRPGGILFFSAFSREDFRAGTGEETEPGTFLRKTGIATHYFTESETASLFPSLVSEQCTTHRWTLRVRGKVYPRAEITAIFRKPLTS